MNADLNFSVFLLTDCGLTFRFVLVKVVSFRCFIPFDSFIYYSRVRVYVKRYDLNISRYFRTRWCTNCGFRLRSCSHRINVSIFKRFFFIFYSFLSIFHGNRCSPVFRRAVSFLPSRSSRLVTVVYAVGGIARGV